jgi:4a-hydroxytetrahydrobiopterin dehydratase
MNDLATKRCQPCEGGVDPLSRAAAEALLPQLGGNWQLSDDGKKILARFKFANYYRTTAFVNAVAWIAHIEDHHPDIQFGFNNAEISYWTHAIDGLSENDFICAAKVDKLLAE